MFLIIKIEFVVSEDKCNWTDFATLLSKTDCLKMIVLPIIKTRAHAADKKQFWLVKRFKQWIQ